MCGYISRPKFTLVVEQVNNYLQLFQIEELNYEYTISNYHCLDLTQNIVEMRKLVKKLHLKTNKAAIAVADSATIRKSIVISESLSQAEQHELALIEVAKYIQGPIDTVLFDYQIVQNEDRTEMLLVIAKRQSILHKIAQINSLGLRVNLIDIESSCIMRVFARIVPKEQRQVRGAWLDVSNGKIKIYIIQNMQLIFINTENYEQDERLTAFKRLDDIFSRINRNFKYFCAAQDDEAIYFVYLFGNYQDLNKLKYKLSQHLNLSVTTPDILKKIAITKEFIKQQLRSTDNGLALAVGLAL